MINTIAVETGYRHYPKRASAGPLLALGSSRLKWYDVARAETPVEPAIRAMARAYLEGQSREGKLELDRDVGFAVLHRCGTDFYFLAPCTWRNSNELWESVYYKDGPGMADFAPFAQTSRHRGTFCVWEMGPVVHERAAWIRFLTSSRDEADLRRYFESTFEGEV